MFDFEQDLGNRNISILVNSLELNKRKRQQEAAELCQAQPAEYKLFGPNWAIFWLVLIVELLIDLIF